MADFDLKVTENDGVILVTTNGYLNNYGGEQVASLCLQKISEGKRKFLLNLANTDMVNSIGVSILIEVIEELQGTSGTIAFCNLAPIVEKTFNIMGISKYSLVVSIPIRLPLLLLFIPSPPLPYSGFVITSL